MYFNWHVMFNIRSDVIVIARGEGGGATVWDPGVVRGLQSGSQGQSGAHCLLRK